MRFAVSVCRGLIAALLLVACSTQPATPALAQWPPIPNRGPAPGLTLTQVGATSFRVTNGSTRSYWLSPQPLEVWHGGFPWVETSELAPGRLEVPPGRSLDMAVNVPADSGQLRVGVRLWDSADSTSGALPWFLWIDASSPGGS